jgi:hypothetical protein
VDNPSNSRADAAYERALAAFHEQSYDVARRWAVEALAHNRQHAGAKALMSRLDVVRAAANPFQGAARGSEVISTDPTVLISRASTSQPLSDTIEPTVLVRRDELGRRPADTDPRVTFPPLPLPRGGDRSTSEPTMIAQSRPKASTPRPKSSFSVGSALQSLGQKLQRRDDVRARSGAQPSSGGSALSTPAARGVMLALGMVVVGALLVGGVFLLVRWMWPAGQVLTITKPTGGTIKGSGIECGTQGNTCSGSFKTGEPIELDAQADKDYVFSGYTGDCAPAGRTSMTESRTCGATFDRVAAAAAAPTFRLTINKPEGGTVVGNGGIYCGTNGSMCTADIPSGVPVSLKGEADDGYSFAQITGDCPSTGEMMMTAAKTCGATFIKTAGPVVNPGVRTSAGPPSAPPPRPKTPPPTAAGSQQSAPPIVTPGPSPTKPGAGGQSGTSTSSTSAPTVPDKPPPPPISAEDHAKKEIAQLVNNYCAALQTLKPASVRSLFHLDNERELKEKYKEYKSLNCTVTSPPEYDRLDASPAGGAQLKFGMKQTVKMASGGAPQTIETTVTMVVSRKDFQSPWLIDRVSHEVKPK